MTTKRRGDPQDRENCPVGFLIPELDITFHSRFPGTATECEYAALLALLEFADINPRLFKNKILEIFVSNEQVVGQVNNILCCNETVRAFHTRTMQYKRKIAFSLNWVRPRDNPAIPPDLGWSDGLEF